MGICASKQASDQKTATEAKQTKAPAETSTTQTQQPNKAGTLPEELKEHAAIVATSQERHDQKAGGSRVRGISLDFLIHFVRSRNLGVIERWDPVQTADSEALEHCFANLSKLVEKEKSLAAINKSHEEKQDTTSKPVTSAAAPAPDVDNKTELIITK
eukprot:g65891.t1